MSTPAIEIAGTRLVPLPSGALYWPEEATLIVADLHLEKASSHARRGIFLPPYDTRATLTRLKALCERLLPSRIVALGDSFHDPEGPSRLASADAAQLTDLTSRHEFVWIAGNHDGLSAAPLGGLVTEMFEAGPLRFRHRPMAGEPAEIAGHLHPCASVTVKGTRFRRRCFASDGLRVILPAFGAFTGGLDLFDEAFDGLFARAVTAFLLAETGVYAFPEHRLARGCV